MSHHSLVASTRRDGIGFTLVELLVVVAVIALLIGVLLPALGRARHAAQAAACMANLRSLEIAQLAYANDNSGQLVMYGYNHGGADLATELSWLNVLQKYDDTPLNVRSALDTSPYWPREQGGSGLAIPGSVPPRYRLSSYGLNEYVTPKPPFDPADPNPRVFDKIHLVRSGTATVQFVTMAFTGSFAGSDHVHASDWWIDDSLPDAPAQLASTQMQTNAVSGRSGSAEAVANYGFLDGHAASMKFADVYTSFIKNNFDPRVAR